MVGKIFCFEKLNRKHIKYLPGGRAGIWSCFDHSEFTGPHRV